MNFEIAPEEQTEIQMLIDCMLDQDLSHDQRLRLNVLLEDNKAVDFYVHYMELHGALSWRSRGNAIASATDVCRERSTPVPTRWYGVAAPRNFASVAIAAVALLLMTSFAIWWVAGLPEDLAEKLRGQEHAVVAKQLQGVTLALEGKNSVIWSFNDEDLEIYSDKGSLPKQFVREILGDSSTPSTITAKWELTEENSRLRLTRLRVDGVISKRLIDVPIAPKGKLRFQLGEFIYNVLPN